MGEKIKAIKDYFIKYGHVSVSKQCTKEYIVYSFYSNYERNLITRQLKRHFKSKDLDGGKTKHRKRVQITFNKFFDDIIYDLVSRGYELEDWQ